MAVKGWVPGSPNVEKPLKTTVNLSLEVRGLLGVQLGDSGVTSVVTTAFRRLGMILDSERVRMQDLFSEAEIEVMKNASRLTVWGIPELEGWVLAENLKKADQSLFDAAGVPRDELVSKVSALSLVEQLAVVTILERALGRVIPEARTVRSEGPAMKVPLYLNDELKGYLGVRDSIGVSPVTTQAVRRYDMVLRHEKAAVNRAVSPAEWSLISEVCSEVNWRKEEVRGGVLSRVQRTSEALFRKWAVDRKKLEGKLFRMALAGQIALVELLEARRKEDAEGGATGQ